MPPIEHYRRTLTSQEINELPLRRFEGDVLVLSSEEEIAGALTGMNGERLLGFDTETRPVFKKGKSYDPALIQLALSDRVLVIQLSQAGLPKVLSKVLADPGVIKTGVAVRDDVAGLKRLSAFEEAGFVDLVIEAGLKSYDVVALIPIVERAGGRMTTWDGRPATAGGRIVATGDPVLHDKVLKLLNR